MRIGAILPHLLVFGGVRRYIELGNAFTRRGHDFSIYTPDGVPPEWLEFNGGVRALSFLPDWEHDVLVSGSPELVRHLDRGRARIKVFYIQIEGVRGEAEIVRSGKYRIMVNSSGLARRIRRRYRTEPLMGIGGVNPDLFHPVERRSAGGAFKIMAYGRLSRPRKGTRFVIDACKRLQRRGCAIELHLFDTLAGGAPDPRIGFDPGVPFRFYMNLPQERMAAMYGAADVFVSAEHRAGWSNTAAESAACGIPLVCTRSGTGDFAENGVSALVMPARNSAAVASRLLALYRDRALAARLGEGARRKILEFTWDAVCASMERTFEDTAVFP